MKIQILYGTESGNAELLAMDLEEHISSEGDHDVELADLQEFEVDALNPETYYIIACSTHGEGELPYTAQGFYENLVEASPNLEGLHYAMFGLGDRFYEDTYSQGSEVLDTKLTELGATRVGEYGRHDASSLEVTPSDAALEWLPQALAAFSDVRENVPAAS
ncbi:flavodoxin domain-containing protein [Enteractinococcus helveticum]|uniref:Nitric oxide synthase n=1 Tax=Enteractinococcus helveticum TaxID=1837282 RepID=A0A1B7LUH0_9MICC|nr:flavodoxin domain-containing protein [Enteractinococcus helveticum]OAV51026.1 nitric oxide synthase [Enteractinococcus helveticum]